jgi:hypothetical protein
VRHDEAGVEGLADAVPGEVAHDPVAEAAGVGLDDTTDDVELAAGAHRLDRTHQRLMGALDQEP